MTKAKAKAARVPWRLRRILVPVDFSEPSLHALRKARDLAAQHHASLTLLHVVEPFHADMLMDTGNLQRARRQQALAELRALVAREFPAGRVKAELRPGHPVEAITRVARESAADLIVLSTRGRTSLPRALIGSVAERVVRHAPCPVLTVRGMNS